MRGKHNKQGKGERKVRLGQDSLPNKAISVAETIYVVLPSPTFWNLNIIILYKYESWVITFGVSVFLHVPDGVQLIVVLVADNLILQQTLQNFLTSSLKLRQDKLECSSLENFFS